MSFLKEEMEPEKRPEAAKETLIARGMGEDRMKTDFVYKMLSGKVLVEVRDLDKQE